MPKGRPSILGRAAVCLMLGLATTVAIAWLGAAFEKAYGAKAIDETLTFPTHTSNSYLQKGVFITRNIVHWEYEVELVPMNPAWINTQTNAADAKSPYWSQAWLPSRPSRPPGTWGNWKHEARLTEIGAGWPFRALCAETDEPVQDPTTRLAVYSFRGGLTLPTHVIKDGATIFLPRCLPLRPIWPGLVADVAIFSLLWGLVVVPMALVIRSRMRRGRCLSCGYDLQGLAADVKCPECGAVRGAA
ncbi:MAG: hypothetical protein QM783_11115 [Phycisphaerales bacterium]